MKTSCLAAASVALNLGLGIVILVLSKPLPVAQPAAAAETASARLDQRVRTNWVRHEIDVTQEGPAFHWSQVQSNDLARYVENLRAIGCPQSSIRDIISGELTDLYLQRRRVVMASLQKEFWNLMVQGMGAIRTRVQKDLEPIQQETIERIDGLVGPKHERHKPNRHHHHVASFLPEDKQRRFVEVNNRCDEMLQALHKAKDSTNHGEKLKAIQQERTEEIQALLTPEEWSEYKLRTSSFASVGADLPGLEMTEDELRAMARTYEQFEAAVRTPEHNAPDYKKKLVEKEEAERLRNEAVKQLLGEERFVTYERANDYEYQEMFNVAERYGLPSSTAERVDEVRKSALDAAKRVSEDGALTMNERHSALFQIQQETQGELEQAFGPRAAKTYLKRGVRWLTDLPNPQ